MLTLDEWAERYLRPFMLNYFNLPDNEIGNQILDQLTKNALTETN